MNKAILVGRTTRDVELRKTQDGTSVANFTVAVDRSYDRDKTDFFDCVIWGKLADNVAKYVGKGSRVGVVGELRNNDYENKQGQTVRKTEINVSEVEFYDTRPPQGQAQPQQNQYQQQTPHYQAPDDWKNIQPQKQTPPKREETIDITSDELPF